MENYHNDDMTMFYQFGKSLEYRWQSAQGCGLLKRAFILGAYVYLPEIQFDYFTANFTPHYLPEIPARRRQMRVFGFIKSHQYQNLPIKYCQMRIGFSW